MGALNDIEMLTHCCGYLLPKLDDGEEHTFRELEHSGATRLVNALRSFRVQRTILVVGMFSIFEAVLQAELQQNAPFKTLEDDLRDAGRPELAEQFRIYHNANNVLKHGEGRSLEKLKNESDLPFEIKTHDSWFEGEGDVVEGQLLVGVTSEFVTTVATLIEEITAVVLRGDLNA